MQSARMVFDEEFWIKKLQENGFKINVTPINLNDNNRNRLNKIADVKNIKILYDNFPAQVIFVETGNISRKKAILLGKELINLSITSALPLFIISNTDESYLIIYLINKNGERTDEARVLHLSDRIYHTDQEILKNLKPFENSQTAVEQYNNIITYQKIIDIQKEFLEGYRKLFEEMENIVKDEIKDYYEYSQRFLGRLMFLYFLQKKGWLGNKDKQYINKIADFKGLNKVFYEGLNNPNNILGLPYLNGSLFDREDYLTDEIENKLNYKMTEFFKKAREFFNRYNFTVDENTPLEIEVSIDPYLLGTVFESMLPENEKRGKGAYYTPPPEIRFIVRRAISNYLTLHGINARDEVVGSGFIDGIDNFVNQLTPVKENDYKNAKELLLNAVVMDPAVGSGGFLVMYMDEVVRIISDMEMKIYGETETHPKQIKDKIIENLYGFDIEGIATEIARLRVWLSYVIEEDRPVPLPNLDLNIVKIEDSLILPNNQSDLSNYDLKKQLTDIRHKYLTSHDKEEKQKLKKEFLELSKQLYQKEIIEKYCPEKPDIIIMNPPYVRQENLVKDKYEGLDIYKNIEKRSDLYVYFLFRAYNLLNEKGVASVITSDKWLEADYGESVQIFLKDMLLQVFQQKEKVFEADINTIIFTFAKIGKNNPVFTNMDFIVLNSYIANDVIQYKSVVRGSINTGKWAFLKSAYTYENYISSKLTKKLLDYYNIKFGIKTGDNKFFYVRDISIKFPFDYQNQPERFNDLELGEPTEGILKRMSLVYVENDYGDRFLIDKKDLQPIIKGPKEFTNYMIEEGKFLVLYIDGEPGNFTKKYIRYGEEKGVNKHATIKNRNPWYKLPNLIPCKLILIGIPNYKFFSGILKNPMLIDAALYAVYGKQEKLLNIFKYYGNSTIFFITMELYGRRMGGGTLEIKVDDYEKMPVPELDKFNIPPPVIDFEHEEIKKYNEYTETRRKIDEWVLKNMGFPDKEIPMLIGNLQKDFVNLVEDRLAKANTKQKRRKKMGDEKWLK